jgi:hypothetical protein
MRAQDRQCQSCASRCLEEATKKLATGEQRADVLLVRLLALPHLAKGVRETPRSYGTEAPREGESEAVAGVEGDLLYWYSLDRGGWRITTTVVDLRWEVDQVHTSTVALWLSEGS